MRTWPLLIVLSAMLIFVAACSSDDDADDATTDNETTTTEVQDAETTETEAEPTEEPDPTETPEPEPTETPEPTPEPEAEAEATEAPEQDSTADDGESDTDDGASSDTGSELGAYLLSLDDLPDGWTQVEESFGDGETDDFDDVSGEPFEAPCGIEPPTDAIDSVAEGERSFEGTELGPFLAQNLIQLESADQAAQAMSYMQEMFACEEWTETDELGEEVTFTIEAVPFDSIGDEAFVIAIGFDFGEEAPEMEMFGDISMDMMIFRRNEFVTMMMYFDVFGMSETDIESIYRIADEKLQ